MSEVMKPLADWSEAHGLTILCIRGPEGELFWVGPVHQSQVPTGVGEDPFHQWTAMSASELRGHLRDGGLSEVQIDEGIELAREWATTVTRRSGAPPVR